MAKFSIITIGTSGVDMRENPLFLEDKKAAFAKNLAFDENTIKTRPDIEYHNLGIKGKFQGSTYFTPRFGISATTYTSASTAIATVVGGNTYLNPLEGGDIGDPILLSGARFIGDTYLFTAESHLVIVNEKGNTHWWSSGIELVMSGGINKDYESEENSHDTLDDKDIRHWLPHNANVGHYIHARNHISVSFGSEFTNSEDLNSELWVSDILTKRGCYIDNDHLKMEEAMLDSMGGTLVAPSKFGKTIALETLPVEEQNGEGFLVDFRECGVLTHNTDDPQRETIFDPETNGNSQEGWDTKRLTNVRLNSVSAVSRYSVVQLPSDIYFRSDYGFHFLKKTLGQGTLKDQTLNHEAHDIQPLFDFDEDNDVSGASVGHWIRGNRFLGSVGFKQLPFHSSSSVAQGIAVMNQATTFTEDDTPRVLWEGLWVFDKDFAGVHKFTNGGARPKDKSYGFIGSDCDTNLFYGEFQNKASGVDVRDGIGSAVQWEYMSGAFTMNGLRHIDRVHSAVLDFITDGSTGDITISIKTDETECWEEWSVITPNTSEKSLLSKAIGEPPKSSREATWFQFKIEGSGYVEIRTFEIESVKVVEKEDGRNHCVPVCIGKEDYYEH